MSQPFEIIGNVAPGDIDHLVIPGRGRSDDGMDISPSGIARIDTAARFYHEYGLAGRGGVVITSGDRSPGDPAGEWAPVPELDGQMKRGIPEAVTGHRLLGNLGVVGNNVLIEADSIDTATNIGNSRDLLPEWGVVGVVAQRRHLERMLTFITPKVLRQQVAGIVVPEALGEQESDSTLAVLFTRLIMLGIKPDTPDLRQKLDRRARLGWKVILGVQKLIPGTPAVYNPGKGQAAA